MATRQYVGARYVPKVSNPREWNKAFQYEALTIVNYGDNSFISKIPVPAGVDISDNKYWQSVAVFNPEVAEYTKQVNTLLANNAMRIYDKVDSENINGATFNRIAKNNLITIVTLEANYNETLTDTYTNGTLTIWPIMRVNENIFNLTESDLNTMPFGSCKYLGAFYAPFIVIETNAKTYLSQQLWAGWDGTNTVIFSFDANELLSKFRVFQTVCNVTALA